MLVLLQSASIRTAGPRVLGMGGGLFGFIFVGVICLVLILVGRCVRDTGTKVLLTCVVPMVIFALPLLIVLSSPRADPYKLETVEPEYDQTWIPRLVTASFQILFVIIAIVSYVLTHACKPVHGSRVEDDVEDFDTATYVFK